MLLQRANSSVQALKNFSRPGLDGRKFQVEVTKTHEVIRTNVATSTHQLL